MALQEHNMPSSNSFKTNGYQFYMSPAAKGEGVAIVVSPKLTPYVTALRCYSSRLISIEIAMEGHRYYSSLRMLRTLAHNTMRTGQNFGKPSKISCKLFQKQLLWLLPETSTRAYMADKKGKRDVLDHMYTVWAHNKSMTK